MWSNTSQEEPIALVRPQSYEIYTPPSLARYVEVANWNWVNLNDLRNACSNTYHDGRKKLGNPKHNVEWIMSETDAGLIEAFGALMKGNRNKEEICYNYVRCTKSTPPTVDDFFIQCPTLPSKTDVREHVIYVPDGWAKEVMTLIRRGVDKVTIEDGQVLWVHLLDNTSYPYQGVR